MTGCVGHNDCGCSPLWVGGSSTAHPHQCSGWSWERVVPAQCSPTLQCTVKHSGASLGGFSRRAALSYDQRAPPLSEIFDCLCAYFGRGMQIHLLCYIYNIFSLNTKHPSLPPPPPPPSPLSWRAHISGRQADSVYAKWVGEHDQALP